jgi:hypothetical protein
MSNKNELVNFRAKQIATIENITYSYAQKKINIIKKALNIDKKRKFLTQNEVQQYYQLQQVDMDLILQKIHN